MKDRPSFEIKAPRYGSCQEHGCAHTEEHRAWSRRDFMTGLGLAAGGTMVLGGTPVHAFARSPLLAHLRHDESDRILVFVQLCGGNDGLNTIIPVEDARYYQARPRLAIPKHLGLPLTDTLRLHPSFEALQGMYGDGQMAIVQGVGYPNSNRSHFRGMDIMHTCEPVKVVSEGWVAKAIRELDPQGENVLTGVNIGQVLPRAMAMQGVPVTSVAKLESYGLMTGISEDDQRDQALQIFQKMYGPAVGTGVVMDYLAQTGGDVLKGADLLADVADRYESPVEYADNPIAKSLRDVARIHFADLGTRIFYTSHGGYDTHANELPTHPKLMNEVSGAISDFLDDLEHHGASDNVTVLVFTEFGRRMRDNGSGTDHGSGGGAFLFGKKVEGGLYGEYPSLNPRDWEHGEDLKHTIDFRGIYGTVLEQWMGVEAKPIVNGQFEQIHPFKA